MKKRALRADQPARSLVWAPCRCQFDSHLQSSPLLACRPAPRPPLWLASPAGVYGDVARFDRLTGQHTESGLAFIGWDQGRTWGKQYSYFLDTLGERPHIALGTRRGGRTVVSPRAIALGQGDAHLVGLANAISESEKPVLLRPLGEPNNSANPYCACHGGSSELDQVVSEGVPAHLRAHARRHRDRDERKAAPARDARHRH